MKVYKNTSSVFKETDSVITEDNIKSFSNYAQLGDTVYQMYVGELPVGIYWAETTLKLCNYKLEEK